MLKPVCAILTVIFILPVLAIANSDFDLNVGNYTANVKIDENGDLSKRGKIAVPYFLTFVHNLDTGHVYGSMVRTELIFDKKGRPSGFGLAHYSVDNVKIRNQKRIKFDVLLGDTTVMNKVKGTFSDSTKTITIALKNKANKKVKQTFKQSEHELSAIYFGGNNNKSVSASGYYPRTGKYIVNLQLFPVNSVSTAGTPIGNYCITYINQLYQTITGWGDVVKGGNEYLGYNLSTHVLDFKAVINKRKEMKLKTWENSEWKESWLTDMGGNCWDPKFPDEGKAFIQRKGNKVVIIMPNPQNVDPGFTAFFIVGGLVDAGHARGEFQDSWLNDQGKEIKEENLRFVFDLSADFEGPGKMVVTNPGRSQGHFNFEIPPAS